MQDKYTLEISEKAKQEIEYFAEYYKNISQDLVERFLEDLYFTSGKLVLAPEIYRIRHRDFRRINFSRFPIMLIFIILEKEKTVKIFACYNQKSSPIKFYK